MRGIYLAQEAHIVQVVPPVDITGGKTGAWVSLKQAQHVTFILGIGVSAAAPAAILVQAAKDNLGTGAVPIPFNLFKQEISSGDVLSLKTPVPATGFAPSANDQIFYVIEVDAAEVYGAAGEGFPFVTVQVTNGANSVIAACFAILSGIRYPEDQNFSALV